MSNGENLLTSTIGEYGMVTIHIEGAPTVFTDESEERYDIRNGLMGHIYEDEQGVKFAHVETTHLDEYLRGSGKGSMLYRAFTRWAIENGAQELSGETPSLDAIETRIRVFGEQNTQFYADDNPNPGVDKSSSVLSVEEAKHHRQVLAEVPYEAFDESEHYFTVSHVLSGLNVSTWEQIKPETKATE